MGRLRAPRAPPGGAEPGGAERERCRAAGGRARSPAQHSAANPARRSTAQPARGAEPSPPQVSTERPARSRPRQVGATVPASRIPWVLAVPTLRRCTRSVLAFPQRYFCHHPRVTSVPASAHRCGAQPHSPSGVQPPVACVDPLPFPGTHGGVRTPLVTAQWVWSVWPRFPLEASSVSDCQRATQPLLIARSLLESESSPGLVLPSSGQNGTWLGGVVVVHRGPYLQ